MWDFLQSCQSAKTINLLSPERNFVISTISLVNMLLSRNFCQKRVQWKLRHFTDMIFSQKFRQINVLLKNFTINWFDGRKFGWQWICRFSTLWHTVMWRVNCMWWNLQQLNPQKIFREINLRYLYIWSIQWNLMLHLYSWGNGG